MKDDGQWRIQGRLTLGKIVLRRTVCLMLILEDDDDRQRFNRLPFKEQYEWLKREIVLFDALHPELQDYHLARFSREIVEYLWEIGDQDVIDLTMEKVMMDGDSATKH